MSHFMHMQIFKYDNMPSKQAASHTHAGYLTSWLADKLTASLPVYL